MAHPLDGAFLKLGRAWEHRKEAKPYFDAFRLTNPYPTRIEIDHKTGQKRWVLEDGFNLPPEKLSIILGEAFYQFRSALDLLAYQLVIANGRTPSSRTAFPICNETGDWDRWHTEAKIKGMSDAAVAIIKKEQPCFGTHSFRTKWFTWLDDLWNVDKHRHLYIPLSGSGGGFFVPNGLPLDAKWFIHSGPVHAGTVLASVEAPHTDVDFAPVKDVVLGEGVKAVGESVYRLMFSMDSLVNGTLRMFDEFFPPRDASRDAPCPSTHANGW